VVAFALGHREEIFRELIHRIFDLLATAGGADTEPPSAPPELCGRVASGEPAAAELIWKAARDNIAVTGTTSIVTTVS
jgi:hypothetical protein